MTEPISAATFYGVHYLRRSPTSCHLISSENPMSDNEYTRAQEKINKIQLAGSIVLGGCVYAALLWFVPIHTMILTALFMLMVIVMSLLTVLGAVNAIGDAAKEGCKVTLGYYIELYPRTAAIMRKLGSLKQ